MRVGGSLGFVKTRERKRESAGVSRALESPLLVIGYIAQLTTNWSSRQHSVDPSTSFCTLSSYISRNATEFRDLPVLRNQLLPSLVLYALIFSVLHRSVASHMANASGLVPAAAPCVGNRRIPALRFGLVSVRRSSVPIRCSQSSVHGGLEEPILGISHSRARLPRNVGMGSKLVGCGSSVPKLVISNDDLSKIVDTNDEWISVRTGIRNRRVLSGEENLCLLSTEAAKGALQMAQVEPADVDLILMCTSSSDDLFGNASQVQRDLGCKNASAFDITAACTGFVIGLITATRFIKGGGYKNILVIGADALSRSVDWTDRGTCILFGDAAGAVVVQACNSDDDCLLGFDLHTDGNGQRHLNTCILEDESDTASNLNGSPAFPPRNTSYSCLHMNGKEVFRFAVRCVPPSIEAALEEAGLVASSVDWLLLHQANQRIIDAVASRLQVPSEKVISNLANYGNTSAASIPLALDEAVRSGKVQPGDVIATAGFGAGVTWGSAILRWG